MTATPHGALTLDTTVLAATDVEQARGFYAAGFRGYVLTYTLNQPSEVRSVMEAAVATGAELLKPAKKALFGAFSGSFRAPDGSIWKLAASSNKDTAATTASPQATESTLILGVKDPLVSAAFYRALGMTTDRDYGKKYIDFQPASERARLCFMERDVLAKDVGATPQSNGFSAMVLTHRASTPSEVDAIGEAAAESGGRTTVAATQSERGYVTCFEDPDGYIWKVST